MINSAKLTVVILSDFYNRTGGIETWLKDFETEVLNKNKIDYKIITMGSSQSFSLSGKKEMPLFASWRKFPIWFINSLFWLISNRKHFSSKTLILGTVPVALPFIIFRKFLRTKIYVSVRGQLVQDTRDLQKSKFYTILMKKFESYIVKNSIVHANGYDTEKYLKLEHNIHSRTIPNCIRQDLVSKNIICNKSMPNHKINVLHLGTIRPIKGVDYIFDEIKMFNKQCNNKKYNFFFAGKGNWSKYFKNEEDAKQHSVYFLGEVDDITNLLKKCHIAIHNSYGSGLSNSFLETTWAGLVPLTPKNTFYSYYNTYDELSFDRDVCGSLCRLMNRLNHENMPDRFDIRKKIDENTWKSAGKKYIEFLEL